MSLFKRTKRLPEQTIDKQLIFDLGLHTGEDTAYYLERGFRVVAIEANPNLCIEASDRLRQYIDTGKLTVLNVALTESYVGKVPFYISAMNSEWSALDRATIEPGAERIAVESITLGVLIERFGCPYYIKSDIEGGDLFVCRQLVQLNQRNRRLMPKYVSVEACTVEWPALLLAAGYDKFQVVNQAEIRRMTPSVSFSVDGVQKCWTFKGHTSGPFGPDLDEKNWMDFSTAARAWLDFERIRTTYPRMVLDNWFDFHATRSDVD